MTEDDKKKLRSIIPKLLHLVNKIVFINCLGFLLNLFQTFINK